MAKRTSPTYERLDPYLEEPWGRSVNSFPDQLTMNLAKPKDDEGKEKAAKAHKQKIRSLEEDPRSLLVYSDGSLMKKGGFPTVGAAVVAYYKGKEIRNWKMGLGRRAEVYDGEMAALSMGAKLALDICTQKPWITTLHFFADNSAATQSIFSLRAQAGQLYAKSFFNDITKFLDRRKENRVAVEWCPGHNDIKGNDRADELAKEATTMASTAPITVTRSNALRRAKANTQRNWVREWRRETKEGHFAIANRLEPKLKPTRRFRETRRENFGRLIQCRTGHAFTGEYRKRFRINENIDCQCGEATQTREHILRECKIYEDHRETLREISRDISIAEILGTEKGIQGLTKFLEESGAFTFSGKPRQVEETPSLEEVDWGDNWDTEWVDGG